MKKGLAAIFVFLSLWLQASHNRAGEIVYMRIAPFTKTVGGMLVQVYTYSITVIKYNDDDSHVMNQQVADRCEDTLYFGDGTKEVVNRINGGTTVCSGCSPCGCAHCGK